MVVKIDSINILAQTLATGIKILSNHHRLINEQDNEFKFEYIKINTEIFAGTKNECHNQGAVSIYKHMLLMDMKSKLNDVSGC